MASIHKRSAKSGVRYDVRYRVNGRQHEKAFKRKVDAAKFRATVEADLARGDWIDQRLSKQTVGEFAEQWFATLGGHRAATRSRYRAILDLHVLPAFGHLPIGRLDHHEVAVWIGQQSERGLSAASISKHRNVLSQICGTAIRAGAIRANPVDGIRIAKSPVRKKRFLSPTEVERLATEITNSPPHPSRPYDTPRDELGLLIRFLAFTGLRIGEAFGLQVGDLDFDSGRVEVQRTASETSGVVTIEHPKSGSVRRVPLPDSLAHDLRLLCGGRGRDAFVWPDSTGGPRRQSHFRTRHFVPAAKRADLAGVTPHDLRHTCVALLVQLGAHPKAIQEWLGHSSITMTLDQYGHLFPSIEEALAGRLDELMFAGDSTT